MGRMVQFRFEWIDPEKRAIRYVAEGSEWNWKDYHTCVRVSLVTLSNHPHLVDSVIDLRESTRPKMPSGVVAHARSFGKKHFPVVSGRAIVLGMPPEAMEQLAPLCDVQGRLVTPDGYIVFVADDAAMQRQLEAWWAADRVEEKS